MSDEKIYRLNFLMQKKIETPTTLGFLQSALKKCLYIAYIYALAELFFSVLTGVNLVKQIMFSTKNHNFRTFELT